VSSGNPVSPNNTVPADLSRPIGFPISAQKNFNLAVSKICVDGVPHQRAFTAPSMRQCNIPSARALQRIDKGEESGINNDLGNP